MQRFSLRISDEEYNSLKKHSEKKERSVNELIREAIREYLKKLDGN